MSKRPYSASFHGNHRGGFHDDIKSAKMNELKTWTTNAESSTPTESIISQKELQDVTTETEEEFDFEQRLEWSFDLDSAVDLLPGGKMCSRPQAGPPESGTQWLIECYPKGPVEDVYGDVYVSVKLVESQDNRSLFVRHVSDGFRRHQFDHETSHFEQTELLRVGTAFKPFCLYPRAKSSGRLTLVLVLHWKTYISSPDIVKEPMIWTMLTKRVGGADRFYRLITARAEWAPNPTSALLRQCSDLMSAPFGCLGVDWRLVLRRNRDSKVVLYLMLLHLPTVVALGVENIDASWEVHYGSAKALAKKDFSEGMKWSCPSLFVAMDNPATVNKKFIVEVEFELPLDTKELPAELALSQIGDEADADVETQTEMDGESNPAASQEDDDDEEDTELLQDSTRRMPKIRAGRSTRNNPP